MARATSDRKFLSALNDLAKTLRILFTAEPEAHDKPPVRAYVEDLSGP